MPEIVYRQVVPEPAQVTARELLASLRLQHDAKQEPPRPYVLVNFVQSLDGRISVDGRSRQLGDDGDHELFRALRERVDAVFAGTNTMAIERYGRMLVQPERREWRRSQGLSPEPLACLVSRSDQLPLEIPLFSEPDARVVVFASSEPDLSGVAADVTFEPLTDDAPALSTAMRVLSERYGVRTLLCEGGPTVFAGLLAEGLVDELYVTLSPQLVGAHGAGSLVGGGPVLKDVLNLRLLTVLERDDALYLRYGIAD